MSAEYLEFSKSLAAQAGDIMQSEREGQLRIQRKLDRTLVTHVDLAIQDLAIDQIIRNFPGHAVIGEERSYGQEDAEHIWRIDPLDGTGEYIEGEDQNGFTYGFGLAKQHRGELELGLFFNPSKDELYTAVHGLGAFLNSYPIHVNHQIFTPGVAYDFTHWESSLGDAHVFEGMLGPALNHYSAIYQGCMVAKGRSAFSVFLGSTVHDIAPATILVSEAGGQVSNIHGRSHDWSRELQGSVYSNGITHDSVLEHLVVYATDIP